MRRIMMLFACIAALAPIAARVAAWPATPQAVPDIACDPGAHPEHMQGRVSAAEVANGYAKTGYSCNTTEVSHYSNLGGYRVHRYVDRSGHVCAFYDTTLLFPANIASDQKSGVFVLDMSNPAHPVRTADLVTPAMQSPHESLNLNVARGLLAADLGNPVTAPGWVDIYDVSKDCRHPVMDSSVPVGMLGHEGTFSPDGRTFWVSSTGGQTLTAIDISNPSFPRPLWMQRGMVVHGLNISDDGNTAYEADLGGGMYGTAGLDIFDVSQIQRRAPNPHGTFISHLTWPDVSLPQVTLPMTIHGHPYLFEVDEFATDGVTGGAPASDAGAHVGAARIIDISDPVHPRVVSNVRLEVNLTHNRAAVLGDPGASSSLQGYAGHYCAIPQRADPGIVACSFIASGLRVFDIKNPLRPVEVAYFNAPVKSSSGNYAMSAPAFDPLHGQIWYSDGNEGFFAVQLTSSALHSWARSR